MPPPTLVVVCGPPGSGKTRLAHTIARTAHEDRERLKALRLEALYASFERISIPAPSIVVDTTDGYAPKLAEIVNFINRP